MTKLAINIELDNGRIIGQTVIPMECDDEQLYLENMYKHRVLSFDVVLRGSMVKTEDMNRVDLEAFKKRQKQCLEMAEDFGYSEDVKSRIRHAKSQIQLDNIMAGARHSL